MTREQVIDEAVRSAIAPGMLRVLRTGRRSIEFFRRHGDHRAIRSEFRRLMAIKEEEDN